MQLRAQRGSAAPSANTTPTQQDQNNNLLLHPSHAPLMTPSTPRASLIAIAIAITRHKQRRLVMQCPTFRNSLHLLWRLLQRIRAAAPWPVFHGGRIHGCFLRSNSAAARSFASFRRGTADPIMVSRNFHSLKSASKSLSHCCFRSALAREYGATAEKKAFRNAENGSHEQSVSCYSVQQSSGWQRNRTQVRTVSEPVVQRILQPRERVRQARCPSVLRSLQAPARAMISGILGRRGRGGLQFTTEYRQ